MKKKFKKYFFDHEKTTPSILKQKFRRFRNFSLTAHSAAQQPKWQNSCSKMWSIEQLYIELGFSLNEEVEFVEFSNLLLAPPLIELYNLLEVNLFLHEYPK